jgi:hypothetical protein
MGDRKNSGYVITLEGHREVVDGWRKAHESEMAAMRTDLGEIKDRVKRLVSIRLTNPGSDYEQRAWDDLMELVNDGDA